MLNLTDDILWDSFRQGNKDALARLFERHYQDLYRYAMKLCQDREAINDLIQDLFIDIWQQKHPKPVLSIKGYLLQSIRYKSIYLNKKKSTIIPMEKEEETEFSISAEEFLIQQEDDKITNLKLGTALQQLSPRQLEVLYLRFYLGTPYREICNILNLEYQVARNHLHVAIRKLRETLSTELSFIGTKRLKNPLN